VVLNLIGSSLFLIAIALLYGVMGTLNMADLAQAVARANPDDAVVVRAAALLLLAVFGLKAALVPLHFWLTPAYTAASAPVAALFAIMTKVGVYALLRVYTLIFDPRPVAPWLFTAALVTVAAAALGTLASRDLREQIARLVVLSIGTLLAGIGLFTPAGIGSALFYLVHTTLITGGLFLLAGIAGARREGTGLEPGGRVPYRNGLGALFLIGGASVAGLPPFSGFVGKLLLLQAGFGSPALAWLWALVLGGGFAALLAVSRAGSILFWKSDDAPVVAAPAPMLLLPVAVLISSAVWLSVFAAPLSDYTAATAAQLLAPERYIGAVFGNMEGPP
jgi:multicomponent K+:H+ antiporter subunit D